MAETSTTVLDDAAHFTGPMPTQTQGSFEPKEEDFVAMKGMEPGEMAGYHELRKQGHPPHEAKFHATDPKGRLYPKGTQDPWVNDQDGE